MEGVETALKVVFIDAGIDLRGGESFMAEDDLDMAHIAASAEKMRSKRMAEAMGRDDRELEGGADLREFHIDDLREAFLLREEEELPMGALDALSERGPSGREVPGKDLGSVP